MQEIKSELDIGWKKKTLGIAGGVMESLTGVMTSYQEALWAG